MKIKKEGKIPPQWERDFECSYCHTVVTANANDIYRIGSRKSLHMYGYKCPSCKKEEIVISDAIPKNIRDCIRSRWF